MSKKASAKNKAKAAQHRAIRQTVARIKRENPKAKVKRTRRGIMIKED